MNSGWIRRVITWCTTYEAPKFHHDSKALASGKKKFFLIVGFLCLFNATIDVLRGKWEPSLVKWQWFADLLITFFGQYGFVGFEFAVAAFFFWRWFSTEK